MRGQPPGRHDSEAEAEAEAVAQSPAQRGRREGAAGILSGLSSRVLVAPFDVLKIRFQLQAARPGASGAEYSGLWQSARLIYRREGMRGLWKGTGPSMVLWGAYSGLQFPVYSACKRELARTDAAFAASFVAGAAGSFVATTLTYPLDIVRTQFVHQALPRGTPLHAVVAGIYARGGLAGFYRGLLPALVQVVPNMAMSFTLYDGLKAQRMRHVGNGIGNGIGIGIGIGPGGKIGTGVGVGPGGGLPAADAFAIGAVTGFCAKLLVHPFDTIKKRLQVGAFPTALECIRSMHAQEGLLSFYKGLSATLLKSSLGTAASFATYEYFLRHFSQTD